jgi:hypothetical protein
MDAVNWLLINVGNAILWLWDLAIGLLKALLGMLDALLNPVLSPTLALLNPICTAIGDVVYAVLAPVPPWLSLTILSALAGVVMLIAFRYTSNQAGIIRTKKEISANLLALKLYKDELRVTLQAQVRLLWALAKLQRYILPPILVMLLPMMLGLGQMGVRHQWRPLRPGEKTYVTMHLGQAAQELAEPQLEPSSGVLVEAGPVSGAGKVVWRVLADAPGRQTLRFDVGGGVIEKELVVGESFERVSVQRPGRRWTAQILHPTEARLPPHSPVQAIEVTYPHARSRICGANYWVLYFFGVSMASALIFRPLFKVTF